MAYTKEQRLINSISGNTKQERNEKKEISTTGSFNIPNKSGDHMRSIKRDDPVNDYDLVNKAYVDSKIVSYDTGWISRSDWTAVHPGSSTTKNADSNVTHNLNAHLSDLIVKFLISSDGTDENSLTIETVSYDSNTAATRHYGYEVREVDSNTIYIQTGQHGIRVINSDGSTSPIDTQDWYYKIVVYKLT